MATPRLARALEALERAVEELAHTACEEIKMLSERATWLDLSARTAKVAD
jgi:phage shock protein A